MPSLALSTLGLGQAIAWVPVGLLAAACAGYAFRGDGDRLLAGVLGGDERRL